MTTAAEFLEVLQTPSYKAALGLLLASGTWVSRADFDSVAASPVAMDDALSDLVMLGQAEFMPQAGYRLKQPRLARDAGRSLMAQPKLSRQVFVQHRDGQLDVGCAMRLGPDPTDVVMVCLKVPAPAGGGGLEEVQWAVDTVVSAMANGQRKGGCDAAGV